MRKNILFVVDELEFKWFEFNKLVTNFWFIREFLLRGLSVLVTTKSRLFVQGAKGCARCNEAFLTKDGDIAYQKDVSIDNTEGAANARSEVIEIENFDAVFFRPDPPVDVDYINACNVFDFVDLSKVKLINNPLAVRNFNEKMHVNLFPQYAPENIVTNSKKQIIEFVGRVGKAVIKPLNRCFGSGVFVLEKNDPNLSSIISSATENGKTIVMVQRYLSGAANGDKRVLLVGGKVLEECVQKLPAPNDFKFAEHSDRFFAQTSLSVKEMEAAQYIAEKLNTMGLPVAGLDMIDGKVIEINVTSPCFFIKEINSLCNIKFEDKVIPLLLDLAGLSLSSPSLV